MIILLIITSNNQIQYLIGIEEFGKLENLTSINLYLGYFKI